MSSPEAGVAPPPIDIDAWRGARRRELLARREALSSEERRAGDERVARLLEEGFPCLAGLTIGFYWPFRGEVDPRLVVHRLRKRGSSTALPVVVGKAKPLEFREWQPGTATLPGAFGLPVPQDAAVVVPEAVLVPPVAFDARGYRLGYGGGFFDRTLAAARPRPLAIGLARAVNRMETIHPQAYDIAMDFIVTEESIQVTEAQGLRRVESAEEAASIARAVLEARRRMTVDELGGLLNTLLEAERAGAAVLAVYTRQVDLGPWARDEMRRMQRDEAHNCGVLLGLIARLGLASSSATGTFLEKALAVRGPVPRLEYLNRGQAWVERKIADALPRITDPDVHRALDAMRTSHSSNIAACNALIVAASRASTRSGGS